MFACISILQYGHRACVFFDVCFVWLVAIVFNFLFTYLFVCVSVSVYVNVCACPCLCVCVCRGEHKRTTCVSLLSPPSCMGSRDLGEVIRLLMAFYLPCPLASHALTSSHYLFIIFETQSHSMFPTGLEFILCVDLTGLNMDGASASASQTLGWTAGMRHLTEMCFGPMLTDFQV